MLMASASHNLDCKQILSNNSEDIKFCIFVKILGSYQLSSVGGFLGSGLSNALNWVHRFWRG